MDVSQRLLDVSHSGRRNSIDSGISESVLSLSAFPDTPSTHTSFTGFPLKNTFNRRLPSVPSSPSPSPPQSPHDWHEGASSISRGTTGVSPIPGLDNIPGLTTSFITKTLQFSDNQDSTAEDTYPPPSAPSRPPSARRTPKSSRVPFPAHLFIDSNHPPLPRIKPMDRSPISDESALLEPHTSIRSDVRTTSLRKSMNIQGAQVVGVAPAVLHSVSNTSSPPSLRHNRPNEVSQYSSAAGPSNPPPQATPIEDRLFDSSSALSLKSYSPSFVSSYVHSLRRVIHHLTKSTPPPVPDLNTDIYTKSTAPYPSSPSLSHLPILSKDEGVSTAMGDPTSGSTPLWLRGSYAPPSPMDQPISPKVHSQPYTGRRRRIIVLLVVFSVLALAGIVSAVVVSVRSKAGLTISCPNNYAGTDCSINATCVCTSDSSRCDGLAQGLLDLIPSVNDLFRTHLTPSEVYTSMWMAMGESKNCVSQATIIDLTPALAQERSPNRRLFAQSALLWNLVESQDLAAAQTLRQFILNAPWLTLSQPDGIDDNDNSFGISISGFSFNFASQKVSQSPISFVSVASPPSDQLAKVGPGAREVLDRMYSVSQASATQRKTALRNYWSTTLQENLSDLDSFVSTFLSSPVLVPFDAESSTIQSLLQSGSVSSIPPPLACLPGLTTSQLAQVNTLESSVFGLHNMSSTDSLDTACYAARPTYGRLDVLQLRLPFLDQETNVARQAAVLQRDVASRMVIYPWQGLSSFPTSEDITDFTVPQLDYRHYGTLSSGEHIILKYLQSIEDTNLASKFVRYVLGNPFGPPGEGFPLDKMPVVEVAIFGFLDSSDFSSIVTSFSTQSGSIFFGSSKASILRDWIHSSAHLPALWTEFSNSTRVVRDTAPASQAFIDTWTAAETALNNNIPFELHEITDSLASTGQFSDASTF